MTADKPWWVPRSGCFIRLVTPEDGIGEASIRRPLPLHEWRIHSIGIGGFYCDLGKAPTVELWCKNCGNHQEKVSLREIHNLIEEGHVVNWAEWEKAFAYLMERGRHSLPPRPKGFGER